ncbi:hypothetical protein CDL12_08960 [Handroanthus impetiginosus]|uniref:Uncharacterized protein n=1 Tax=Handroanthus impetiginosus TaxID=429701 RepID=A0A2G9HLG7_9LAMI|nr:hypothetical protein CDL12_08960 [Handroanthus impetiginosus]
MDYLYANEECSSGCESGWTLYLQHSAISQYNQENQYLDARTKGVLAQAKTSKVQPEEQDEDEDEDLSMVSDASSGPPHLQEEEEVNDTNGYFYHYPIDNKLINNSYSMKKNREKPRRKGQDQSSATLLDDTASSPFFDFSKKSYNQLPSLENVLEYSQGYSTTRFEVRPPYQEHYDFLQCSPSGNHLQHNQLS